MKDPDLQIRRGGGGGHPDPEIKGWGWGTRSEKRFFRRFGPQSALTIRGGRKRGPRAPSLDLPLHVAIVVVGS